MVVPPLDPEGVEVVLLLLFESELPDEELEVLPVLLVPPLLELLFPFSEVSLTLAGRLISSKSPDIEESHPDKLPPTNPPHKKAAT
jgi:hypothetical protein